MKNYFKCFFFWLHIYLSLSTKMTDIKFSLSTFLKRNSILLSKSCVIDDYQNIHMYICQWDIQEWWEYFFGNITVFVLFFVVFDRVKEPQWIICERVDQFCKTSMKTYNCLFEVGNSWNERDGGVQLVMVMLGVFNELFLWATTFFKFIVRCFHTERFLGIIVGGTTEFLIVNYLLKILNN